MKNNYIAIVIPGSGMLIKVNYLTYIEKLNKIYRLKNMNYIGINSVIFFN